MKKLVLGLVILAGLSSLGAAYVIAKEKAAEEDTAKPAEETAKETPEAAAPTGVFAPEEFKGTVFEAVSANPELSTFMTAINASGLAEELKGKGPITVFAPDNEAFTKLPEGFLDTLLEEKDSPVLKGIISYHIIPGKILSFHLTQPETPVASLNERAVTLKKNPEGFFLGAALVTKADIQTTNGALHIINTVDLNPQALAPAMPTQTPPAEASAPPAGTPEPAPEETAPATPEAEKAVEPAPAE